MYKNHLKIAWRHLLRDRQFTLLNLVGLATGLACAILIYLWVNDELQVDKFNEKDSQLYQVMHTKSAGDETIENTPGLLAAALSAEMPEVEYAASVVPSTWFTNKGLVSFGEKQLRADAQFISRNYFDIFSCNFLEGDKRGLFKGRYNIAISRDLALKLFNRTANITGSIVEWNQEGFNGRYMVTGMFEKFPSNATSQFDVLLNYELFLEKNPKLQKWNNSDPSTFLLLRKGVDATQFNKKLAGYMKNKDEKSAAVLFIQRFSDRYLHSHYENSKPSGGRIEYVQLFTIIGIFILFIACINFMNLSTANAFRRARETGIKKLVGAARGTIIVQYVIESMLAMFLSLTLAVIMVIMVVPQFNEITGKHLALYPSTRLMLAITGITLLTGLAAGSYPAIYLSRFRPATVLKGKFSSSINELIGRRALVVFQFTLSVILIVCVLTIYRQIQLVQTKNLGYKRDQLIYFEKGGKLPEDKTYYRPGGPYEKELESFINQVRSMPGVTAVSNFRHNITNRHGGTTAVSWKGKALNEETQFTDIAAGYDFIETLGIGMKEGRTFSRDFGSERSTVIFNESAVKAMGLTNPVGKTVNIWGEDRQIIGVTKDFHFESLYENIKPCFFDFSLNHRASKIMVKIKAGTERATIDRLAKFYKSYTGEPFDYKFLSDDYKALYASENRVAILSRYAAAIAVLISCLGLFGLAAFTAQKRQKEIGIRKVVGATVSNVLLLLSTDYLKQVLLAMAIGFPIAWWAMHSWLNGFAYRISIQTNVFIITAVSVTLICLFTVSFQAIKAAVANPVKSLRTE